jgi:hypothetical protein
MKKNNYKIIIPVIIAFLGFLIACSKSYLDVPVSGQLAPGTLANKIGVEALLVGAYSLLDGEGSNAGTANGPWATAGSNWVYGSVAGGDAHKGSDPGDQNLITPIETWNTSPSNNYLDQLWQQRFDGVQRANDAIRVMRLAKDMTPADTIQVTAEARFLRAHYAFELRKNFLNVPWINESVTYSAGNFLVANDHDIFTDIEADFAYAYANLPATQSQVGRANKWAAAAYLAKTYMFEKKFAEARTLLTTVINSGVTAGGKKYALTARYRDAFSADSKNSSESVFAAQSTVNDGTAGGNANTGDGLNFPYGGQTGCCGFFQPSYSLANSFKVDANGLPFLDGSYNATDLKSDYGIASKDPYTPDNTTPLDPRIDWTVGRRGIPFLDWGPMAGQDWVRNQASAGPYEPVKNMFFASEKGTQTDASGWTAGFTANNINLIRFSDVLLLAAEAEVEGGGTLAQATAYVNQVRTRAANPAGFVQGSVANYKIGLYTSTFASADYARSAIRFERKIELAMEGHRFYDLTRWGIGATELNAYAAHELKSKYLIMAGASYTANKSEYLPIPQIEIDLSNSNGKSVLKQNPGY